MNAEVQHRWCELIVALKIKDELPFVAEFLHQNQSMGIYLYGELMLSNDKSFKKKANEVYEDLKDELDPSTRHNVESIIFP